MALLIKFKARRYAMDYPRFQSAFKIFHHLKNIKLNNSYFVSDNELVIAYYLDFPSKEAYPDFKFVPFEFGILNEFRKKLSELRNLNDGSKAGFEIRGKIVIEEKKFNFYFILNPEKYCRKEAYDIRFDIYSNAHADDLEQLEGYINNFKEKVLNSIRIYQNNREENDLIIRKAILTQSKNEHNMEEWRLIYLRYPYELIIELHRHLITIKDERYKSRFEFIDEEKISNHLISNNNFGIALGKFAKEANIAIESSSLIFIPNEENSMKNFVRQLNEKILIPTAELFKPKEEVDEKINEILKRV